MGKYVRKEMACDGEVNKQGEERLNKFLNVQVSDTTEDD
jgi:hypothetical protein